MFYGPQGPNSWMGGYPPQPQFIYVPMPQQGQGGIQTISSAEEAKRLYKEMIKRERKLRKEWDEGLKKKEGDKKPEGKKVDTVFATKIEVALFMCLIALPIGFAEALLVRFLLAHIV